MPIIKKGASLRHLKVLDPFMGGEQPSLGLSLGMQMSGATSIQLLGFVVNNEIAQVDVAEVKRLSSCKIPRPR